MKTNVVKIPCTIDRDLLLKSLHIKPDSHLLENVDKMIEQALEIGVPKTAYKIAYVDSKSDDHVVVDGIKFTSRILRVNLEETFKVVPYVITCGVELEKWAKTYDDMFSKLCADLIMEGILFTAHYSFFQKIDEEFNLGHAVIMNPGSLEDWPLREQEPLFQLLGNVEEMIGVKLSDSYLITPLKSTSGFRFPKKGDYENCQLCPRENCPGRRAPYDKNLYNEK
ncbi:MAG: vitamin B12 dependent methionine synthase [Dehalobacterium sp.]